MKISRSDTKCLFQRRYIPEVLQLAHEIPIGDHLGITKHLTTLPDMSGVQVFGKKYQSFVEFVIPAKSLES